MVFKRLFRSLWLLHGRSPLFDIPVPCRLPHRAWFLAHGDITGLMTLRYNFRTSWHEFGLNEWEFMMRFIKPGMGVFDVGANQGFYTILASKRVGPEGRVFAFEPAPSEYRKLRRNVWINRCRNVVLEPRAVGCDTGVTEFHACGAGFGGLGSRRPLAEGQRSIPTKQIQVPLVSLDYYVKENNVTSLDFVKIDVEGGELDVLEGAKGYVLPTLRPVVLCEIEECRARQWGYPTSSVFKSLLDCGYQWFTISARGALLPYEPRSAGEASVNNFVGVPVEKLEQTVEGK